jgi:hypothetical protein
MKFLESSKEQNGIHYIIKMILHSQLNSPMMME